MRRGVVFASLTAPAAVWAGMVLWAQWTAGARTSAAGELGLVVRVALASSSWAVRGLPFAIIPLAIGWPLVVPAIARATETPHRASRTRDVVTWWAVSVGAFVMMLLAGGVFYTRISEAGVPFLVCCGWTAVVAFWMSLAAAYGVQQQRRSSGRSVWQPRDLIVGLMALNCIGMYVLPLLAVAAFRRGERGEAVEQGDEADEAFGGTRPPGQERRG